ncbi:hypothetical protein N7478_000155 [Penicillium angulare]|uniref:uncharacterized protein n=1 Tax=Penicillium angulare TaxID=116970 RepID=UPI0025411AEB|nr:uncharacterized protein N7478_000155 [Penicillium angulare]KAJ5290904.1 hypothetical protein N7478_000155 [Penicillium angulare]
MDWTNDFETLGGELVWGSGGEIQDLLQNFGLDATEVTPLYAMEFHTGEALVMFEADSTFYLFNRIEGSLYQIIQPNDLTTIVELIDDKNKGLRSLEIEQL